jgi:hypothetical protein
MVSNPFSNSQPEAAKTEEAKVNTPKLEMPKLFAPKREAKTEKKNEFTGVHRLRHKGKKVKTEATKEATKTKASILAEFGGNESDIPVNHSYWRMR